jgi:hypothetical protein
VARIVLENAMGDFKVTVARTGEACKWRQGVADEWYIKGEEVCRNLLEEASGALQEAEEREGAEARVRLMKSHCEELESLAGQMERQAAAEMEPELLVELAEEMEYRKDNVASMAQALKETVPAEFKERAQQAIRDSAKMVEEGRRRLGDLRARLEFRSADSEAGSYKGPVGPVEGAGTRYHPPAGDPERRRRTEGDSAPVADDLAALLRGWGQLRANDSGWLTFDGRYANYPRFKREWVAYREMYHSVVNDDLAAKTLREKCVKGDALRMVSHLDDLQEMWDTLDTCYERPEKYMEEVLRPIVEFRKYRVFDSGAVREFYSILRAAIKGARGIGRLDLLINDQTVPRIMGRMPYTHWREWAIKRPEWVQEDLGVAFERFVERKWQDALNVGAAEPQPWEPEGPKRERMISSKTAAEKAPQGHKGIAKTVGAANVVTQQPDEGSQPPA